jgi:pyruvate/2-oxoglutarate dehydrogenase complex dihydrolipoamide dehydrogenase (E3) component
VGAQLSFDVLVIGGGQAGIPLAHALAGRGRGVALAERKALGGSCVNFGCTPTKAAIASARVAHFARGGATFGLRIATVEVDFPAVLERARSILVRSRRSLESDLEGSANPKLLRGHARFSGRDADGFRLDVGGASVLAREVVIDTGTRSEIPQIEGLDAVDFLHAGNWLDRPELPSHVVFLGGGAVAFEMSQLYRRMGSRVTVLDKGEGFLHEEDEDVATYLRMLLESEGIAFQDRAAVERVEARRGGVELAVRGAYGVSALQASHLFIAAGRRPNTDDLGLETIGLAPAEDGTVPVDERLATPVRGVWAAGDVRGGPMYTHTAWDDFRVLESQMAGDGSRTTERVVPYAVFTDPELGRVGATEKSAREAGGAVRVGRFEMRDNSKARELGETDGFVKLVTGESGTILGAAVLAREGAELVHVLVALMNARAPYAVLRDAIQIHPTLAEAVQSAAAAVDTPPRGAASEARRAQPAEPASVR